MLPSPLLLVGQRSRQCDRQRTDIGVGFCPENVEIAGKQLRFRQELAVHFERGGDFYHAARYLLQAAQKARQSSAYREAIDYAEAGLRLA